MSNHEMSPAFLTKEYRALKPRKPGKIIPIRPLDLGRYSPTSICYGKHSSTFFTDSLCRIRDDMLHGKSTHEERKDKMGLQNTAKREAAKRICRDVVARAKAHGIHLEKAYLHFEFDNKYCRKGTTHRVNVSVAQAKVHRIEISTLLIPPLPGTAATVKMKGHEKRMLDQSVDLWHTDTGGNLAIIWCSSDGTEYNVGEKLKKTDLVGDYYPARAMGMIGNLAPGRLFMVPVRHFVHRSPLIACNTNRVFLRVFACPQQE